MADPVKYPIQRMAREGMFDDAFQRDPVLALISGVWKQEDVSKNAPKFLSEKSNNQIDIMTDKMRQDQEKRAAEKVAAERGKPYSFYPSQDYIKRNLAPEQYFENDLAALARAQREAVKSGVMTPEVAKYFLANILTEGTKRSGNYGLSFPYYSQSGADPYKEAAKKMGITPEIAGSEGRPYAYRIVPNPNVPGKFDVKEWRTVPPNAPFYEPRNAFDAKGNFNYGDKSYSAEDRLYNAKLAAMILGSKGKVPQEAITAWNGIGAGAENHWKKVQALQDALQLPQNASLLKRYNELLQAK